MHAAQPNPRLSPTEARILEAFLNPEATFLAVAQSLKLDLQDLLDALTSPAIRAALDILSQLDAIRRRLCLAPMVPGALNALKRLLDRSDNLTEVRRAATTILNTYTRLERTQPRPLFQRSRAETDAPAMERYHAIVAEREAARTRASAAPPSRRSAEADQAAVTEPGATPAPIGPSTQHVPFAPARAPPLGHGPPAVLARRGGRPPLAHAA